MTQAYVAGAAMTRFGKYPDRQAAELGREVVSTLLNELKLEGDEIEGAFFGRSFSGAIDGQVSVPGQVCLRELGISDIPVYNFDNACAAAPTALSCAAQMVDSGMFESVLVVGMDKLYARKRRTSMEALLGAMDVGEMGWMLGPDVSDDEVGSLFMEHYYARIARTYLEETRASVDDLARIAVKNREHAVLNPYAQYQEPIKLNDVLSAPMVAAPLTKLMCSPLTDGAAAFVVMSKARAARLEEPKVRVASCAMRSGHPRRGTEAPVMARAAEEAFNSAGIGPETIDLAEVHEASAVAELIAMEELGLCPKGQAVAYLRNGATTLGGSIPINVSGGLLSRGHPGAGTGAAQIVELVWQLQGRSGKRQVDGARFGLAQSTGGLVGDEAACTTVTILERE